MKKLLCAIVLMFLFYSETFAQEVFFKTGINSTTYDFKTSEGTKIMDFIPGTGSAFEIGFGFPIFGKANKDSPNSYLQTTTPTWLRNEVSFSLDAYNSFGGDINNNYYWETTFAGVRNRLSVLGNFGKMELGLVGLLGASKMIAGTQVLNRSRFDLKAFDDFKGLFVQGGLGGSASYQVFSQASLSISYDYSKSLPVRGQSTERLNINTQRIVFGIHFKLD